MLYFLLACSILTSLVAVAGIGLSAYLYGITQTQGYLIVEGKRRERRLSREKETWQNLTLQRSGLGTLKRRPERQDPRPPTRTFVAPSQAINEMRGQDNKVPPAIQRQFRDAIIQEGANQ